MRALARASRLLERASGELSLAQYRVLAAVADGDERASRIAARLALGKPTISAAVDSLCARGLLSRARVDTDQRADALRVTAAGRRALDTVEAALVERLEAVAAYAADPEALLAALADLGGAVDAFVDARAAAKRIRNEPNRSPA